MPAAEVTPAYRGVMAGFAPIIRWWGRLDVSGLEHLPSSGPLLVAGNHDSFWDPLAIGTAGLERRQIQALAKSSLWKNALVGKVLDGMRQIPIDRRKGDVGALDRAISELRARSGLGRIAQAVPETQVVCCTVEGTVDIARFPKRPRIRVRFFPPAGGGLAAGESAADLPARLLAEIRASAPIVACGRKGRPASPQATPG